MDSGGGYEICQFNIHTELTFAAKTDTIEKGDDTIQNTIYNTIRKYYVKITSYPSYKGLEFFLSKALVCGLKCYEFIRSQVF